MFRSVLENLPIGHIAKNVDISPSNAWKNKQKNCIALMTLYGEQDSFEGIAECDEYYARLSFKGKRDPAFFIETLGRMPHHHWTREQKIEWLKKHGFYDDLVNNPKRLEELLASTNTYKRGLSYDQTCILTCKDEKDNLYMHPVCIGRLETEDVKRELHGKFAEDTIFLTDSHTSYPDFVRNEKIQHVAIKADKHTNGQYNLARINALHSEIAKYWPRQQERSPSTKYMDLSLILFWWLQKNAELSTAEKVEAIYDIIKNQHAEIDARYESIKNRKLSINGKGQFGDTL